MSGFLTEEGIRDPEERREDAGSLREEQESGESEYIDSEMEALDKKDAEEDHKLLEHFQEKYFLPGSKLQAMRETIEERVAERINTEPGEYLSQAASVNAITELLYRYVTRDGNRDRKLRARYDMLSCSHTISMAECYCSEAILMAAMDCLKYYKGEEGKFIAYFEYALNRNITQTLGKETSDEIKSGVAWGYGDKQRVISEVYKEIYRLHASVDSDTILAEARKKNPDIEEIDVLKYLSSSVSMDTPLSKDADDNSPDSRLEYIDRSQNWTEYKPEPMAIRREAQRDVFRVVGNLWATKQDRSKGYLAACLTNHFAGMIISDEEYLLPLAREEKWFVPEVYQWVLDHKKEGRMQHGMIARMYGKSPERLSTSFQEFMKKLRKYMHPEDVEDEDC